VFIGPQLPAGLRMLAVSPQRLLLYLALDVNGMIGAILALARQARRRPAIWRAIFSPSSPARRRSSARD